MSPSFRLPGGVGAGLLVRHQVLAGALGDDHHRTAALGHPALQGGQESRFAVQRERYLRDQHEIGVVVGQRGVAGDETRRAGPSASPARPR